MGLNIRQIDNADRLPPQPRDGRPAPYARAPIEPATVLILGVLVLVALVVVVPLFWWLFRDWFRYGDGGLWLRGLGALGGLWLAGRVWRSWAITRVRDIPVSTRGVLRVDPLPLLGALLEVDRTYAGAVTPAQVTYSPEYHQAPPSVPTQENAALPAGPGLSLVPDAEWRRWCDRAPHLVIAGRTDAGKTTLMEALANERACAGDELLILDPHCQPGKWNGLPAVGGGNDFATILDMLPRLMLELDERYQAFEQGKPTDDFLRLTVIIDEAPALVDYCIDLTPSGGRRIKDQRWPKFAKRLGSEARKVRISVILGAQSTLVQDLLINSQMKENYLRIGLGDRARPLIHEEPNAKRRAQLDELLRGQAHPAAMEWRGDFHLLDTSAVPDLAARRVSGTAAWVPPSPAYTPATAAKARPDATVRASVPGAIVYPAGVTSTNGRIAWLLKSGYSYRQIERELSVSHATIRDVARALQAMDAKTTTNGHARP